MGGTSGFAAKYASTAVTAFCASLRYSASIVPSPKLRA